MLARGEGAGRLRPVGRGQPDATAVPVGVEVDRRDDEGDGAAVGRDAGIADLDQPADVGGPHPLLPVVHPASTHWAAASRAMGTRNGEQDT